MAESWARRAMAIGVAVSAALLAACTVETRPSSSGGFAYATGAGSSGGGSSSSSGSNAMSQPMLVDVDPNRTMTAEPGQGVGIFTEYVTGGHWHVWWTCDTVQTGLGCSFDVTLSIASGAIANVAGQALAGTDQILQPASGTLEVVAQTSTEIGGVAFDTPPGTIVTIDAKLNGQENGAILFFVQLGDPGDGGPLQPLVNGGYRGQLTDPLMFEPSSP